MPANRFLNSIGMNTSINSRGENVNTTEEIMRYLGARWIRTSVGGSVSSLTNLPETSLPGAGTSIASYKQLYDNAGIRFRKQNIAECGQAYLSKGFRLSG